MIDEPGRDPATNAEHEQQPASDPDRQSIGTTTTGSAAGHAAAAATRGDRARARTARSRSHPAARARPRVPAYRSGADAEATRGGRAAPLRRFLAVTCSLPARPGPEGPAGGTAAACRHRLRQAAAGAFRRDAMRCLMSRSSAACSDPLLLLQCGRHGLNTFLSLLCRFDLPRDRGPAW